MDVKTKLDGAQRACTHRQTLERMKPWLKAAGITRLAEITGLDRTGIPVAQSIRPDSKSVCVDSGKGFTTDAALCSAMMESFERHVAESFPINSFFDKGRNLKDTETRVQMVKGGFYHPDIPIEWTDMFGLRSKQRKLVPAVSVRLEQSQPLFPIFKTSFGSTTNGLSSGNTLNEAIAGGIYEVIERDQVSTSFTRDIRAQRVDLDTIKDEVVGSLVEKLRTNGIMPVLLDVTQDIDVPTYIGYTFDIEGGTGVHKGYSSHLSPHVAQARALCEAVQSRVVYLSGSRDDISHEKFTKSRTIDAASAIKTFYEFDTIDANKHEDCSADSFTADIAVLLHKLHKAKMPEPLVKVFKHPYPCSVVRVTIPTAEGYYHKGGRIGERGIA